MVNQCKAVEMVPGQEECRDPGRTMKYVFRSQAQREDNLCVAPGGSALDKRGEKSV